MRIGTSAIRATPSDAGGALEPGIDTAVGSRCAGSSVAVGRATRVLAGSGVREGVRVGEYSILSAVGVAVAAGGKVEVGAEAGNCPALADGCGVHAVSPLASNHSASPVNPRCLFCI